MRQSEIAKLYGIDPSRLNRILNGKEKITTDETARVMARVLKVTPEYLLTDPPARTLKARFYELYEFGGDK